MATTDKHECVAIASSRAVINNKVIPATIIISRASGKITEIHESVLSRSALPTDIEIIDHSPKLLLPGLVDAHVHLNEPGRTEWEGFYTGTQAAAFGGVTTMIDMPLNAIPPTTTVANFNEKIAAARGKCWVDVGFYGGLIPGNEAELKPLVKAGVRGFKGFLIDSGVDEFPAVSAQDITKAFKELADEPTTAMFHAEMLPPNDTSTAGDPVGPRTQYQTFLDSRPSSLEFTAIRQILDLAHLAPNLPLHVVHLSAIEAIPLLRHARSEGIPITAETCFHYLSLAAESIGAGDTRHKCCPPIRSQSNQDGLWSELLRKDDGCIKTVVSDHSPCTPNLKVLPSSIPGSVASKSGQTEGDFFTAWGGISSVGLGISILWTSQAERRFDITDLVRWCCVDTARQVGLHHMKGKLEVGFDADIAVFDDEAIWTVVESTMLFRNKVSPYQGRRLKGLVSETWLRGRKVYSRSDGFVESRPRGELLLEPRRIDR